MEDGHLIELTLDDVDFDQLCAASTRFGNMWHDQFGRFENHYERSATPPRKEWTYGYWVDGGFFVVLILRAYLQHLNEEFEIFYDTCYPTDAGGWLILTDYASDAQERHKDAYTRS
jgi:hypothetical protein